MPRPVTWLPRLPEIARRVRDSVRSHYERREIEVLFELQPRAAQLLLEALPTVPVGRAHLVERETLLAFLEGVREADDVSAFLKSRRTQTAPPSRRKLRTLIRRDSEPVSLASLPQSISLARCRLEVSFRTLEDLAQSLYALAQTIDTDGDEIARLYEVECETGSEAGADVGEVAAMLRGLEEQEAAWRARKQEGSERVQDKGGTY